MSDRLRIAVLLCRKLAPLVACVLAAQASGQCPDDNTLTGAAQNVPCPGTITVPCVQGGQYALVNVTLGNIYTFSTCTSGAFDSQITIYNNTGGASLGYNDDACGIFGFQSSVSWTATFSGQVRALVDQWNCANNTTCIPLTITCAAPPPPVTNNNPCQAIALAVTNTCQPTTFTNAGANLTTAPVIPAPGCGNLVAGSADVWFTFVAPPSGIAIIEGGAGTMADGAMALYSASACAGTYNLIQCSDDDIGAMPFLAFDNLTPGTTYYVRFWGYGTATGSFTLCVHGPTSIPAGACVYLLELSDGFGDGWGGSYVSVSVNGGPATVYTCNTLYNAFLIGLNPGNTILVTYTVNGGPFQGENLFTLGFLSTGQTIYNSGSPPSTAPWSQTVTCDPPPAAQEDCVGGTTLCTGSNVDNNTNNTGSVADLSAANSGCLLANEQQGTWYNFAISTGGTLGMVIDPAGNDDYDWAIWGPYPPGTTTTTACPPIGTPIRCSFASGLESLTATGSYNTGIGVNNLAWANPQYAPPLPIYSDPAGGGDGWTPGINVTAGQIYFLYISNFSLSGQEFTLSWQLGAGASLDCLLLPMELISFEANPTGQQVLLEWATASEHGTDRFLLQRKDGGDEFRTIGTMDASGGSEQTLHYSFLDASPASGLNLYRLVLTDLNGQETISGTRAVRLLPSGTTPTPFPVPVSDVAWWPLGDQAMLRHVTVVDGTGRTVLDLQQATIEGGLLRIDLSGVPDGLYSLVAWDHGGAPISTARLVKR